MTRSRTTATPANALRPEEINDFLQQKHVARLGTPRQDGYCHVTPVWFLWEDARVLFPLAEDRVHLRNLRRIPKATLCVDEDRRPLGGPDAGARAVVMRGPAELIGPARLGEKNGRLALVMKATARKYLGESAADLVLSSAEVTDQLWTLVIVTPTNTLSWEFGKE